MAKERSIAPLSADALSVFCYQLSLMTHAGIGSEEGVEVLAEDAADAGNKSLLTALHASLLEGTPLSEALSASGAFPGYMVRMVEIGQAAGRLDQVLSALAAYYRRESETASAIRRAVLYPAVMAVLVAAVFLVLMTRVLPVFQQVFEHLGLTLSPAAQALMAAGTAGQYVGGALVVLLAVGAVILLVLSRRQGAGARPMEARLLGRGRAAQAVDRSRFSSAMALMLSSGLPLDEAMERTVHLLDGSALAPALADCQSRMEQGEDFYKAVTACGLLDGLQAGLLGAGFRSGVPEQAMEELASRCQEEADERLSALDSRRQSIGTLPSAFAPVSTRIKGLSAVGITAPSAGRLTPRMRLTRNVAPTSSAPVLPAETKASPRPSASARRPTAMEESRPAFKSAVGCSSMENTPSACRISMPERSSPSCSAQALIFCVSPTRVIS